MKKLARYLTIIFVLVFMVGITSILGMTSGCGGGGDNDSSSSAKEVSITIKNYPSTLASLSDNFIVEGTLYTSVEMSETTKLAGPVGATSENDKKNLKFSFDDVNDGTYYLKIFFKTETLADDDVSANNKTPNTSKSTQDQREAAIELCVETAWNYAEGACHENNITEDKCKELLREVCSEDWEGWAELLDDNEGGQSDDTSDGTDGLDSEYSESEDTEIDTTGGEEDIYQESGGVILASLKAEVHFNGNTSHSLEFQAEHFDLSYDDDGDGITNLNEMIIGTDLANPDTDEDGTQDGEDEDSVVDSEDDPGSDSSGSSGEGTAPAADSDSDSNAVDDAGSTPSPQSNDTDGDGVYDDHDNCTNIANADQLDTDGDDSGDACDDDDDNDGILDNEDAFPLYASETIDTDGDGQGDNADRDDDGDWVQDEEDAFPLDPNEWKDTDNDGTGDNADLNDDGDWILDEEDNCPLLPSEDQTDSDGDGWGDLCDCQPNNPEVHPGAIDEPDIKYRDTNCDGIDGDLKNAVFVADFESGYFSNVGSRDYPLTSLSDAISRAQQRGLSDIYVAYNASMKTLPDNISIPVSIYGGYALNFSYRNINANTTSLEIRGLSNTPGQIVIDGMRLYSSPYVAPITFQNADLYFDHVDFQIYGHEAENLTGFEIIDSDVVINHSKIHASSALISKYISVDNSFLLMKNSYLEGGHNQLQATGIDIGFGIVLLINNNFDMGPFLGGDSKAVAVSFEDIAPIMVNNAFVIYDAREQYIIECLNPEAILLEWSNNLLSLNNGAEMAYYKDCDGGLIQTIEDFNNIDNGVPDLIIDDNITCENDCRHWNLYDGGKPKIDSPLLDAGKDVSMPEYGFVITDYEGDPRPSGPAYDIGYTERQ